MVDGVAASDMGDPGADSATNEKALPLLSMEKCGQANSELRVK